MHRQSQEEVAAAARRRLELLGRELDAAGLRRVDETAGGPGSQREPEPVPDQPVPGGWEPGDRGDPDGADPALPSASRIAPVGRHLPPPRPGVGRRLVGWLGDQVPDTLRGRVQLEAGPVLVVVALVSLAVAVTGVVVLRMGGDAEVVRPQLETAGSPDALVPSRSPVAVPSPSAPTGAAATGVPGAAPGATGASVTVDVAGKVRRPGIATLPAGSRVADALREAGGPRGGVDLTGLNLARVLVDGEQILVGRRAVAAAAQPGFQPGGLAAGASTAAPDATGPLVNLNTATPEQLETLPGVGPVTAQKILDWRAAHGAFSSVDELLEVDGIGDKTLADIAPHVTL